MAEEKIKSEPGFLGLLSLWEGMLIITTIFLSVKFNFEYLGRKLALQIIYYNKKGVVRFTTPF